MAYLNKKNFKYKSYSLSLNPEKGCFAFRSFIALFYGHKRPQDQPPYRHNNRLNKGIQYPKFPTVIHTPVSGWQRFRWRFFLFRKTLTVSCQMACSLGAIWCFYQTIHLTNTDEKLCAIHTANLNFLSDFLVNWGEFILPFTVVYPCVILFFYIEKYEPWLRKHKLDADAFFLWQIFTFLLTCAAISVMLYDKEAASNFLLLINSKFLFGEITKDLIQEWINHYKITATIQQWISNDKVVSSIISVILLILRYGSFFFYLWVCSHIIRDYLLSSKFSRRHRDKIYAVVTRYPYLSKQRRRFFYWCWRNYALPKKIVWIPWFLFVLLDRTMSINELLLWIHHLGFF